MWYAPTLTETLPTWLIICNGISLFMRQTLDAMDGKQARRTEGSSPLGEFLDHGVCDAIEILFISYISGALCQLGRTPLFFFFTVGGMLSHFLEMWATYITGEIEFWYFSFTESELVAVSVHFVLAAVGQHYCQVVIPGTSLRYTSALFYIVLVQFLLAFVGAINRIRKWIAKQKPQISPAQQSEYYSFTIPGIYVSVASLLWYLSDPTVITIHVIPFVTAVGCLIANSSCRIVQSRVCKEKPSTFYIVSLGMLGGIANAWLHFVNPVTYLHYYCVLCVLEYAHYSYSVCQDLKQILGINCFTEPWKRPKL